MTLLEQIQKEHAAAFTHGGKFHADDVFSAALLLHFNPRLTICLLYTSDAADE